MTLNLSFFGKSCLVIAEAGNLRQLIVTALHQIGLPNVAKADDIEAAIYELSQSAYDAVICAEAEFAGSVEVVKRIRRDCRGPAAAVPIIYLTGNMDPAHLSMILNSGANSVMTLPIGIRAEVWDDVQSTQGGRTDDATAIPARGTAKANRNGALNGSISGSRFNFGTLSHTEIGDMKSFLEFDLGTDASPTFRLRHAYIANADWLAGQTWSTFMDMDSLPDLLSAGGSVGYSWLRRPQVRYSIQTGDRDKLDMAAEVPTSDYSAPSAINTAPDLVLKYTAGQSWGHYALGGMVRYLRSDTGTGDKADQIVWGFLGGVSIKTFGDDILTLQTVDGTGVGGALNQGTGLSAAVVNRSFQTFDAFGGSLAYKHYWNPKLRSTLAVGYDQFANASRNIGTNGLGIRSLASVHGNIVYSPIAPMDVGIEYGYEAFTASPTGTGTASRVLGVVKYGY